MTRKGNSQCQAFNESCFRLLASLPNGHVFYDTTQSAGSSLRSVHLAPGWGVGGCFPTREGLGSD